MSKNSIITNEKIDESTFIRPLRKEDFEYLESVADRRLGTGYFDYDDFLFRTEYPELNLVADVDGKAVAMISMTPEEPTSLANAVKMDLDELLKDAAGRPVIHFRTALCDEEHDHAGLTKRLLEIVINNAKVLGYGVIISPTWKYHGKAPALRLQTDLGFVDIGEKHLLWVEQKKYKCIICNGPCKCDAILLKLVL